MLKEYVNPFIDVEEALIKDIIVQSLKARLLANDYFVVLR